MWGVKLNIAYALAYVNTFFLSNRWQNIAAMQNQNKTF
jgi:hypothetical protein